ncbi:MAG: hypothetical protein OEM97_02015 [Acidimicrobiia bacterium]|nr:hypothetical protein [Acidimicrobiia bacterium]
MEIFVAVVIVVVILVGFSVFAGRRRRELQAKVQVDLTGDRAVTDFVAPRPVVKEFHVRGTEALVTFAVPVPEGEKDDVLADLLLTEAVEVTREKSHSLPIDQVTTVVALAGTGATPVEVGRRALENPGELPPPLGVDHMLHFSKIGFDPLDKQFDDDAGRAGFVAPPAHGDQLAPIGTELRLPKAVEIGLRSQGIDPETMTAGEMVRTLLTLFGYSLSSGEKPSTFFSEKAGQRTYIREEPHAPDAHPELGESVVKQFMIDFASSGADRGLLITEKYGPFEVYERERREPRVRFVTRERLQKFVDSLALG